MKIIAKLGTHASELIEVDGRTLGRTRPIPVGKIILIKQRTLGKWERAKVEKVYCTDEYSKYNFHFLSLV